MYFLYSFMLLHAEVTFEHVQLWGFHAPAIANVHPRHPSIAAAHIGAVLRHEDFIMAEVLRLNFSTQRHWESPKPERSIP